MPIRRNYDYLDKNIDYYYLDKNKICSFKLNYLC